MIRESIIKLCNGEDLQGEETATVFREIMEGTATPSQMAAFLTALRLKGETIEEITAAARIMREKMVKINVRTDVDIDREEINEDMETIIDTCGTGGSGTNTFNISTASAFVVAGAGIKVAKHGNRSASSPCGSADVLENLGVDITMSPEQSADCVKKIGIGFLYAPLFHPAMKNVGATRKEIGVRTIFNILGPLASPAGVNAQVLGVYSAALVEVMANVLNNLKIKRAFVVHGLDTLDEVTITGPTLVAEVKNAKVTVSEIRPEDFGMLSRSPKEIEGGSAPENAKKVIAVLSGEKGARRDIVLLNSALAIVCAGKAETIKEGITLAEKSIDSGAAMEKLNQLKKIQK
ncbi:MAG: anthranilate phosphoribosyltransferase [Candidatus Omnitrophota bacterium]|nr:anthranilate phosphoribosyltransferase [bacterium]MBU3929813.1 anthranilate phosphoribosyltransferase [bacterium]MBU4122612.1 anthranilate phosphoribosyltransferase [bacterium]